MMIEIQSYMYCLCYTIFALEFVHVRGDMFDSNDLGALIELSDNVLIRQLMDTVADASGMTTEETTTTTTTTATTTTTTTATTTTTTSRIRCSDTSETLLPNGTCVPNLVARNITVDIIYSNNTSSQNKSDALITYFQTRPDFSNTSNQFAYLIAADVDDTIDKLDGINSTIVDPLRFIMSESTNNGEIIGAYSIYNSTKRTVNKITNSNVPYSDISAAAIIGQKSIDNVRRINMLILEDITPYEKIDIADNKTVVSPIIVLGLNKTNSSQSTDVNLYFRDIKYEYGGKRTNGEYSCAFLNTSSSKWSTYGSTKPVYEEKNQLFNCTFNHTTTFALIWLPNILLSEYLTAQDIASLVFLSISILCFIGVIIHSLVNRLRKSFVSLLALDLLPLISAASTAILFIFYIALTMTVYTQTPTEPVTKCFTSAIVLMFFTYFFLIFMFCIKTSVGYFNYLRFIHLFPEPPFRKLYILLFISFIVSLAWTLFAIGFHSNESFHIIQTHGNKICWFSRDVIYYFLTIPVSIFLLLNFILICLIGKHIIQHAHNATSPHGTYRRMKRCVLVLVSSCVTQGLAWIFGPFLTFIDPQAANILGWFFVIFNGLEGFWTVLLYLIIRTQRAYEKKRTTQIFSSKLSIDKQRQDDLFRDLFYRTTFDLDTTSTEL